MKPSENSNLYFFAVWYFVFCLLMLSLTSCSKITDDAYSASPARIEIHVQSIDARALIVADGVTFKTDGTGSHRVDVFIVESLDTLKVHKLSGEKITVAVHDYIRGAIYNIGEVEGSEGFRFGKG
ncbi:hypothetical protein [Sphingobacterium suaedae]|uniref:DUF3244 domain-containing protein n=1 Tax=Sphingobacterium suaedae TaxID=1686402 RepID=A0ABW5KGX3_9SPHI